MLEKFFLYHWYQKKKTYLAYLLMPVALIYQFVSFIRFLYYTKIIKSKPNRIPVIIVGNITLGGVGKTPLVAQIYQELSKNGYKPAIISRGYGRSKKGNLIVTEHSSSDEVGDEPLMLYQMLNAPVIVASKRRKAVALVEECFPQVDVIISDDGLQHYALPREIEIAVIDGQRLLGNGLIFPAGPLREKSSRLNKVDMIIYNGQNYISPINHTPKHYIMELYPDSLINLKTNQKEASSYLIANEVYAVAGIGNPNRFFSTLTELGYQMIEKPFPDHYSYSRSDLDFNRDLAVIMTMKDAVKCQNIANENCWYLEVSAKIDRSFFNQLLELLMSK